MNKKILISLSLIAAVSVIAVGGTIAYNTDFEKSENNTFAMGDTLDLKIDSNCHFNGMHCKEAPDGAYRWDGKNDNDTCSCVWDEKSLTSEKFFNFTSLKAGDFGEATISMHVIGDDAYVRFKVDNIENYDNGCNLPECIAEGGTWDPATQTCPGVTCGNPGSDESGELGENMDFAIWFDMGSQWGYGCPSEEPNCDLQVYDPTEGDNILNGPWEPLTLVEGDGNESAGEWVELKKLSGEYIPFGECKTYYIGVACLA
jgi:predicted ribosomally synthesized peptide with SipW-like signal peptide